MELQTIANQYLKPERIMEYLEILKKRDSGDYEKSATFFKYVIVTRYKEKDAYKSISKLWLCKDKISTIDECLLYFQEKQEEGCTSKFKRDKILTVFSCKSYSL